jgi:hypothetical protein
MFFCTFQLSRYNIHDGDQFHIDLKPDARKPPHTHQIGRDKQAILVNIYFVFLVANSTRRARKKSTDTSPNSSFSSASSEEDKSPLPFSFDSLQKLSNQTDTSLQQAFVQLDQLYPSVASTPQINDDDDDLLFAAAMACSQVKRN